MGTRRRAREFALQILYQLDVQAAVATTRRSRCSGELRGDAPRPRARPRPISARSQPFAAQLVRGVREHLAELDAQIQGASKNWRLERMARVDRNMLRLALSS